MFSSTNTNDEQISSVVRENLQTLPNAGESYLIGAGRQRNIIAQRQHIRNAINNVSRVLRRLYV